MDNQAFQERVREGATRLGVTLGANTLADFSRFAAELLRWNAKVNLTAITDWKEVAEKHMIDSLGAWSELEGAQSVLDLGAGAGFPGLPLKLARPSWDITMVDAVAKKVAFIKQMVVTLGLHPGARALHLRVNGHADNEGLGRFDALVSRALMDLEPWMQLASNYVSPGGRVVAMMGQSPGEVRARRAVEAAGLVFVHLREYALPFSGDARAVVLAQRPG